LGNPLTVEDSFGPRVLERIRAVPDLSEVDLLDAHTDLLGHIDRLASYPLVIIVDAMLDPAGKVAAAGEVVTIGEQMLLSFPDEARSIHQISPVMALKLFRQLYPDAVTQVVLVAFCTSEVQFSGTLREDTIGQAANEVLRLCGGFC
jgi:hydrogenase maturation protease